MRHHKLLATLTDMLKVFGDRKIALVRELTKLHEQVIHTTFSEAIEIYSNEKSPRGEFVLIVEGYEGTNDEKVYTLEEAVTLAKEYMKEGNSASTAAKISASDTGIKKNEIYRMLV